MTGTVTSTTEYRAERGKPVDRKALAEWLLSLPDGDVTLDSIYDTDTRGESYGTVRGMKATWRSAL